MTKSIGYVNYTGYTFQRSCEIIWLILDDRYYRYQIEKYIEIFFEVMEAE